MKDLIGRTITEGDAVAFNPPSYKGLTLGIVVGFTPKMVKVASVFEKETTSNIYPHDVAIVNSPEVTAILLKRKG